MEQFTILPEQTQANTAILPDNGQVVESIFKAGAQRFAQNEYQYQKHKQELADKLDKLDVDTSTFWEQDVPEAMNETKDYRDFVAENPQFLSPDMSNADQMKGAMDLSSKKHNILQNGTTSNAQKLFYYKQLEYMQAHPDLYDTPENKQKLEEYKNAKIGDRQPFDLKQKINWNALTYADTLQKALNEKTALDDKSGLKTTTTATNLSKAENTYAALINANDDQTVAGLAEANQAINAAKKGINDPTINIDVPYYDISGGGTKIKTQVDPTKPNITNLLPNGTKKLADMTPQEWLVSNSLPVVWQNHYETNYIPPAQTNVNVNTGDGTNKKPEGVYEHIGTTFVNALPTVAGATTVDEAADGLSKATGLTLTPSTDTDLMAFNVQDVQALNTPFVFNNENSQMQVKGKPIQKSNDLINPTTNQAGNISLKPDNLKVVIGNDTNNAMSRSTAFKALQAGTAKPYLRIEVSYNGVKHYQFIDLSNPDWRAQLDQYYQGENNLKAGTVTNTPTTTTPSSGGFNFGNIK